MKERRIWIASGEFVVVTGCESKLIYRLVDFLFENSAQDDLGVVYRDAFLLPFYYEMLVRGTGHEKQVVVGSLQYNMRRLVPEL